MKEPYFKLLASIGATSHWIMGARTDRTLHYGSNVYAMEELVAELGTAFLCATLGISTYPRPGHAACSASWLQVLNWSQGKGIDRCARGLRHFVSLVPRVRATLPLPPRGSQRAQPTLVFAPPSEHAHWKTANINKVAANFKLARFTATQRIS